MQEVKRRHREQKANEKMGRCLDCRGLNWIKWDPSTLHKMQRLVLAEPSVLHLSKLMEGNREQRESEESHSNHITCSAYNIQRLIGDSTGTSRLWEQTFQKVM